MDHRLSSTFIIITITAFTIASSGCTGGGGHTPPGIPAFVLLRMDTGATGEELGLTIGNEVGTFQVKDICPGGASSHSSVIFNGGYVFMGGVAYFSATDGTNGQELWKTDGTEERTVSSRCTC